MPQLMNPQPQQNMQDVTNSLGTATVDTLKGVGATPQGAVGDSGQAIIQALMAKSAQKALVKNLDDHAQNLLDTHPDGATILASVLATHMANNPETSQEGDVNSSNTPIQKQAQDIITPEHRTILGNILNGIGNITGFNAMSNISEQGAKALKLSNLSAAQDILGQKPLQPKDIAEMDINTYKAGLEATHQALAVEGQKFNALQDLYGKLNETKGKPNQLLGMPSEEQKNVYKSLQLAAKNINTHVNNLGELINNRPKVSSQGVSSRNEEITSKTKVGKYTLVK